MQEILEFHTFTYVIDLCDSNFWYLCFSIFIWLLDIGHSRQNYLFWTETPYNQRGLGKIVSQRHLVNLYCNRGTRFNPIIISKSCRDNLCKYFPIFEEVKKYPPNFKTKISCQLELTQTFSYSTKIFISASLNRKY